TNSLFTNVLRLFYYKTLTAVALKELRLFKGHSKLQCFTKVKYTNATQTNNTNTKIKENPSKPDGADLTSFSSAKASGVIRAYKNQQPLYKRIEAVIIKYLFTLVLIRT